MSLKTLVTCFILTILMGYVIALVQVYDRTHFDLSRAILFYRGAETGDEAGIFLPQSFRTLLSVAHVHSFSQPLMFAMLGLVFIFTRASEKLKILFTLLLFAGSITSNITPWLVRYFSPRMAVLLPLSQFAMITGFMVMSAWSIIEMWFGKKYKHGREGV